MTIQELDEQGISYYPDNDGGLWYYEPGTGNVRKVAE